MKRFMDLVPTLAVTAFISTGHATHWVRGPAWAVGILCIALVAFALYYLRGQKADSPIAWTLSAYVAIAGISLWRLPGSVGRVIVAAPEACLYTLLFLMAAVPLVIGRRPFTEFFARRQQPEAVWATPQFKAINRNMTAMWAGLFALSAISASLHLWISALTVPVDYIFRLAVPLALMAGVGPVLNKRYPVYYMEKAGRALQGAAPAHPNAAGGQPPQEDKMPAIADITSAKTLIEMMPAGFNAAAAGDMKANIQYDITGDEEFTAYLAIADGACTYHDGPADSPDLTVKSPADVWLKIAKGELDGQAAFMTGQFKAEGNLGILLQMGNLFNAG